MKKIKNFVDFRASVELVDLKKVYLMAHSDMFSFSNLDHTVQVVGSMIYTFLLPPGIFPDVIDKDLPLYNYGNKEELPELLKAGLIKPRNVYNLPKKLPNASDKLKFHKKMDGISFMPKTVYTVEDAMKMKFPIIGKPKEGSTGVGITIFDTKEKLEEYDGVDLDTYSFKFDLKREYRVISLKGKALYIAERIPVNKKAHELREGVESEDMFMIPGKYDEQSAYDWKIKKFGVRGVPSKKKIENICKKTLDTLELDILGLDIATDAKGKLWLIEANTCPGLNDDQVIHIYVAIFEDFYGRKIEKYSMDKIDDYSRELRARSKDRDDGIKFSFYPKPGTSMEHWTIDNKSPSVRSSLERSFGGSLIDIKDKQDKQ